VKLAELSVTELHSHLCGSGVFFQIGPFIAHLRSDLPDLPKLLHRLYAGYPLAEDDAFADFHIELLRSKGLRRWWGAQVQFYVDGEPPFSPFPQDTALPFLEWGLNWCVATRAHHYLMLHAGVVEKNGKTVLLPAWPGSGKSTLCAALIHRGWRLLSDEFALVRPGDLAIIPVPRLIALKNGSIAVIRAFASDAVLGPEFPKTRKGTVAHLCPPAASIDCAHQVGQAAWIVFPHFKAGAELRLQPLLKGKAFLKLSGNSFNYEQIGPRGFETVGGLIESCECYIFHYGDLGQAVAQMDALVAD
jgi:HprK-related kinase A